MLTSLNLSHVETLIRGCAWLFFLPGFCRSPPLMIAGGRVFVVPCIQQIQRLAKNKGFFVHLN